MTSINTFYIITFVFSFVLSFIFLLVTINSKNNMASILAAVFGLLTLLIGGASINNLI